MSERDTAKLVQEAYEIFRSGDIPALARMGSDDIVWQLPEIDDVPCEQVRDFFATFNDVHQAKEFRPKEFIAQFDTVVALGQYTWRANSTGREYGGHWAHVIRVRDEKIATFQVYCCIRLATDGVAEPGTELIMSELENTKFVRKAYETLKTGKIDALGSLFSDNIAWRFPEPKNAPLVGGPSGREDVYRFFASFAETRGARGFEPSEFIAQADKVVALGPYTWRLKFTGQEYVGDWAHVFTIRDRRIAGLHVYYCARAAKNAGTEKNNPEESEQHA